MAGRGWKMSALEMSTGSPSHSYTCIPSAGGQLTVDQGYQQELRPNLEQGRTLYVETAQQMHIY